MRSVLLSGDFSERKQKLLRAHAIASRAHALAVTCAHDNPINDTHYARAQFRAAHALLNTRLRESLNAF